MLSWLRWLVRWGAEWYLDLDDLAVSSRWVKTNRYSREGDAL